MVLGALGRLTGEAVRGLARNLFSGFYERGISANKALTELRGLGLGYRRTDFLKDFSQGLGTYSQETRIRFVGPDKIPTEGILSEKYHGVPDKYSFVFKQSGIDADTGEVRDNFFFYHRNTLDTKSTMEEDAQEWASEQAGRYGIEDSIVKIIEGYINPLWA